MTKTTFFLILAIATTATDAASRTWSANRDTYTWDDFKLEFNREYLSDAEHDMRRSLFETNLRDVRAHNAAGTYTWRRGINHLSDRTSDELAKMRGYSKTLARATRAREGFPQGYGRPVDASAKPGAAPEEAAGPIDWTHVMTPMKDQGMCGSCWSMGAAEAAEAQHVDQTFAEHSFLCCHHELV